MALSTKPGRLVSPKFAEPELEAQAAETRAAGELSLVGEKPLPVAS